MIRRLRISGSDVTNAVNVLNSAPELSASFHSTSSTDDNNIVYLDIQLGTKYTMPEIYKRISKSCEGYSPKDLKNLT